MAVDAGAGQIASSLERFQGDPLWLRERRQAAGQAFAAAPLPQKHHTRIRERDLAQWQPLDLPDARGGGATVAPGERTRVVFENGQLIRVEGADRLPTGVLLMDLREAALRHGDLVQRVLGQVVADDQKFTALNSALFPAGLFLYVPAGIHLPDAVEVRVRFREGSTLLHRTAVIAEPGSRLTLLQETEASTGAVLADVTEVLVGEGAAVTVGAVQEIARKGVASFARGAAVERDGRIEWLLGEFGGGLLLSGYDSQLLGNGATSESLTVYYGEGRQHLDLGSAAHHRAPHTTSRMETRGVLTGSSRTVYTGLAEIEKGAFGSDGRQKAQALLLSEHARVDALPILEIDENDVMAAHAASAGPLDPEALYYLMSRGIAESEATSLLVRAFLEPILERLPAGTIREDIEARIERKVRGR